MRPLQRPAEQESGWQRAEPHRPERAGAPGGGGAGDECHAGRTLRHQLRLERRARQRDLCVRVSARPVPMSRVPSRRHMIGRRLPWVGRGSLMPFPEVPGPSHSSAAVLVGDEGCDGSAGRKEDRRASAQQREGWRCVGGAAPGAEAPGRRPPEATRRNPAPATPRWGAEPGSQDLPEMRWPDASGGLDLAEVRSLPRMALCQLQGKGHGAVAAVQGTAEADPRPGRSAARRCASRRLGSDANDAEAWSCHEPGTAPNRRDRPPRPSRPTRRPSRIDARGRR